MKTLSVLLLVASFPWFLASVTAEETKVTREHRLDYITAEEAFFETIKVLAESEKQSAEILKNLEALRG